MSSGYNKRYVERSFTAPAPSAKWKLVDAKTGADIALPCERKDFRGDTVKVTGFAPPRHEGSTGRVYIGGGEFFPNLVGAKIVAA